MGGLSVSNDFVSDHGLVKWAAKARIPDLAQTVADALAPPLALKPDAIVDRYDSISYRQLEARVHPKGGQPLFIALANCVNTAISICQSTDATRETG